MFSLRIRGQDPSLNTEPKGTEKKSQGYYNTWYHGHYLSATVSEDLPWKNSILLTEEKVYDGNIQELFGPVFSPRINPLTGRDLYGQ